MNWEKKDVINICKVIAFGIVLYWILQNLPMLGIVIQTIIGILSPFIIGIAIAFIVNIPMSIFENKIFVNRKKKEKLPKSKIAKISKIKRLISMLLSITIIVLIIIGVIFLIIPDLVNVIKGAIEYLPELLENIKQLIKQIITDHPEVEDVLINVQNNLENFNTEIIKNLTTLGTDLVTLSFGMLSSTLNAIVKIVIAIIFAIYILMGKERIFASIKRMTYAFFSEEKANKLCKIGELSKKSFYNFITGQFTECIILGALCAIGMLILRIPYSATIGTLVAVTAFIPIMGAFIGGTIGTILLLPISIPQAVTFVVFFVILQQIENNLIYPRVVGNSVGIPGILVLVSITVFGTLWGPIGMIISLPVVAVLYTLVGEIINKRLKEKGIKISEKGTVNGTLAEKLGDTLKEDSKEQLKEHLEENSSEDLE